MIARVTGVGSGALVTALWFWLIGTVPILETLVGLLLGIAAGLLVWAVVDRRIHPPERDAR